MKFSEIIRTISHKIADETHWLTRQKLFVFGGTLVVIGISMGAFESVQDSGQKHDYSEVFELSLPSRNLTGVPATSKAASDPVSSAPESEDQWKKVTVRPGQTLDTIFKKQGFRISILHEILALNAETRGLTFIRPGDTFEFQSAGDGEFLSMRYPLDEARILLVRNDQQSLRAEILNRVIYSEISEAEGVIQTSLFMAAKKAGLNDAMIMKLATIFGWDIDFVLDIRAGDRFMLVYEKLYRDGEFLRDGDILAATFINQGERFQAIHFKEGEVSAYYAPDGRSMRKAFLRAPLNFAYISSSFNPKRMHPVLKRIRPHNGIDYYAPKGTPVYAAGKGVVTRSGYSAANGHHVFVKHANNIETKYLHFTKRAVKKGQNVKQGQTIGYVGSTGLATGPHLHYEFVVKGVHRNPRTVALPKEEPLKGNTLLAFQTRAAPMLTQLNRMESVSMYASRE